MQTFFVPLGLLVWVGATPKRRCDCAVIEIDNPRASNPTGRALPGKAVTFWLEIRKTQVSVPGTRNLAVVLRRKQCKQGANTRYIDSDRFMSLATPPNFNGHTIGAGPSRAGQNRLANSPNFFTMPTGGKRGG